MDRRRTITERKSPDTWTITEESSFPSPLAVSSAETPSVWPLIPAGTAPRNLIERLAVKARSTPVSVRALTRLWTDWALMPSAFARSRNGTLELVFNWLQMRRPVSSMRNGLGTQSRDLYLFSAGLNRAPLW